MCHCLACQQRTGSVFGVQARFPLEAITSRQGEATAFTRRGDSGNATTHFFCPRCGTTVYWEMSAQPGVVAVAVGAFADPGFPAPRLSVYEERAHAWALPSGFDIEHMD